MDKTGKQTNRQTDIINFFNFLSQRSFALVCKVGLVHLSGQGASKKEAKRKAASDMLEQLSEAGISAHALVFASEAKKEDKVEEVKQSKGVQDINLDIKATKMQDLQRTSLKCRYNNGLVH